MRLRRSILWVVLASLFGLPAVGIAQIDDAPSLEGVSEDRTPPAGSAYVHSREGGAANSRVI